MLTSNTLGKALTSRNRVFALVAPCSGLPWHGQPRHIYLKIYPNHLFEMVITTNQPAFVSESGYLVVWLVVKALIRLVGVMSCVGWDGCLMRGVPTSEWEQLWLPLWLPPSSLLTQHHTARPCIEHGR